MDIEISLEDLLKNGSHFGHNKKRWNPKMEKYIYGEKNGIHILDLRKSLPLIENALKFAHESSKNNKKFLFVSTKKQHSEIVETIAKETTTEEQKKRFKEIEKVILPFLYNLSKSDEPYIHWPNRGPIIKAQIEKVLKLTRG